MSEAKPKLAVSDEQFPSLRPCDQEGIAMVAAKPMAHEGSVPECPRLC